MGVGMERGIVYRCVALCTVLMYTVCAFLGEGVGGWLLRIYIFELRTLRSAIFRS